MSCIVRAARADEARALSELAQRSKARWGYLPSLMKAFEAELTLTAQDLEEAFVIEADGQLAGFFSLQPLSETRVELGHLFVEPALQRRGLGQVMIADACQRAAERGSAVLVIQGDPNAEPFYLRVGATRVGERESESVPGRMLPLFELPVAQTP